MNRSAASLPAGASEPRRVRSVPVDLVGTLLARLPHAADALAWVRDGQGLVGWGQAARIELAGPDRFEAARDWWAEVVAHAEVTDEVGVRGSGPVVFGSLAFRDDEPSVLVVPAVVLGRAGGQTWLTTVGDPPRLASPDSVRPVEGLRYSRGDVGVTDHRAAVAAAVARIDAGDLDKVVLAHDLLAVADADIDARALLAALAAANPDCWTFAVEGLVGATPEMLIRRSGDRVESHVLAGTTGRGGDAVENERRVRALSDSVKDREEHRFAVESLVDSLAGHVGDLRVTPDPAPLELAHVIHLATSVTANVSDDSHLFDLLGALHPSAAIGGTPTDAALALINEIEGINRGRYTGPVGWLDARGDGEWGIALRCAQLDGPTARLFAGGGIVAGSDPDDEVLEAAAKLIPMRAALEAAALS